LFQLIPVLPFALLIVWTALCALASIFNLGVLKSVIVFLAGVLPFVVMKLTRTRGPRSLFWLLNTFHHWINPVQCEALDYILKNAKQGDPESVFKSFDTYCKNHYFCMNVGEAKGVFMDKAVRACNPKTAVELGSYCGYSTIRIASLLKPGSVVHTVDPDALGHAISAKLVQFSGVTDKVNAWFGYSTDVLKKMAANGMVIDFLLVDHVKELYLPDVQLAISLNLFRKGSVIFADNVLVPGAPEYKKWIFEQPFFKSEMHTVSIEGMQKKINDHSVSSHFFSAHL